MTARLDYSGLKVLAKKLGRPVSTLYALATQNDPFYSGSPATEAEAIWFADIWGSFGFRHGAHLRRIHYTLISQPSPVPLVDGRPYQNTLECWAKLGQASKHARYLDLVPLEAFVDRRNPDPIIFLEDGEEGGIDVDSGDLWHLELSRELPDLPSLRLKRPDRAQRYHLEIWVEKTTALDVLTPLASRFGANLVPGAGEMSITACHRLFERIKASGRPARILYVSDFDPGGRSMPVAVARKTEFMLHRSGLDLDIQLRPVVLTHEQCIRYKLPRTPIKETEQRAARFEERFGEGATELDALEALHRGEFRRIMQRELDRYYDHELDHRAAAQAHRAREEMDDIEASVLEAHREKIASLSARYQEIREQVEAFRSDAETLWLAIEGDLEARAPELEDFNWPEPAGGEEDGAPLFDSGRDYVTQISFYKAFQDKPTEQHKKRPNGARGAA